MASAILAVCLSSHDQLSVPEVSVGLRKEKDRVFSWEDVPERDSNKDNMKLLLLLHVFLMDPPSWYL